MANVSPNEDYGQQVGKPGEVRKYTYVLNHDGTAVIDAALSVDVRGARSVMGYIKSDHTGSITGGILKFRLHEDVGTSTGATVATASGIVVNGTITAPSLLVGVVPMYLSPTIGNTTWDGTNTAGTVTAVLEVAF